MKRKRELQLRQDEMRRANQAYREFASVGGYLEHASKLVSLQYLVVTMVDIIGAELEVTLEKANLKSAKTISIQNTVTRATDGYKKMFEGAMGKDSTLEWANDATQLELELYKFAGIKPLRPKRKAMREAKVKIEEKYGVELIDLE